MNRINKRLAQMRADGRKALVAYLVNGDPNREVTLPTMHAMVAAGVDIIELGVPFSDPMAEGPVIARGHERALVHNVSLRDSIDLVRQFRETDKETPVLLMGYANPVERLGYRIFSEAAAAGGVDGLLTVDMPPEEAEELNRELKAVGIENIFLLAPTTTPARASHIVELAGGFLYYVSLKGVTGAGHLDLASVEEKVSEIRRLTDLPVCVGFGIKDAATAQAIARCADGAVVGSIIVEAMGARPDASAEQVASAVADLLRPIRAGLDAL